MTAAITAKPVATEGPTPIVQESSPSGTPAPPAAETEPVPAGDTGSARPSLVYAGLADVTASVQMSGLVTNLVEDGGTCTFELRSGSALVTRSQAGLADAASTSCGTVEVPLSELDRGRWEATLNYAGPGGSGTSGIVTVDIP